jgi:hypothetical protein
MILTRILDVLFFNTLEFWTGSNPIAMAPGEEIIRYTSQDGKDLKIIIRQNQVIVEDLDNPGQELALDYRPLERSWYYTSAEGKVKIATLSEDQADFFLPSGKSYTLEKAM